MGEQHSKTILFVCTGNTCRSSMAEALAKEMFGHSNSREQTAQKNHTAPKVQRGHINLNIISAGTGALANEPASPQARSVMTEMGLDLSAHKARVLTQELLQEADLVLTMTEGHKSQIIMRWPEMREKVYVLKEYAGAPTGLGIVKEKTTQLYREIGKEELRNQDILDPFGQPSEVYRHCAKELAEYIPRAIEKFLARK